MVACTFLQLKRLNGVIDIHVYCDPDALPRSIDAIDIRKACPRRGMRGLVLKTITSHRIHGILVRKVCRASRFWRDDLNRTWGVKSAAVEAMTG